MSARPATGCVIGWCVIVTVILGCNGATGFELDDAISILKLGREIVKEIMFTWNALAPDKTSELDGVELPLLRGKERKVIERIGEVTRQLDRLRLEQQAMTASMINSLMRDLPQLMRLEYRLEKLADYMSQIDIADLQLKRYIKGGYDNATEQGKWRLEQHTLENFATWVVSHHPSSIRGLMDRIHYLFVPQKFRQAEERSPLLGSGLFAHILDIMQESRANMCNLQQSPQQLLYNLYNTVAITELKGYAMMQFSWMLLRLYNKGNFTVESELMRERYQERTIQKVAALKEAMKTAESDMWRCDPRQHSKGETYVDLTQLLQGHIQNEVDMNSESTCRENCGYYSYTKSYGCYQNQYCAKQQRCNGKLIDCRYIDSDMWVCQADSQSDRRYNWIEYENGRILGKKSSCNRGTTKVDSWWRWLFWHCSYCFCLCDEQGPKSDRYFNLREVKADVANNKVVTGLRFVKKNRVIHLQIQEAGLLPRGGINMTSVQWRPVDDYRISDSDVYNGKDYHTLSWEQRAIDLDDLVAPEGSVLTGVRFRRVGTHLNLEIMVTPLNFTAGTLDKPHQKSIWHGNDNTDASLVEPRKRLYISHPDVPTLTNEGSVVDSRSDQFLLFTHSDIDADAAQTTVPFLDAQPVAPEPPTLLAGAGIYHKGRPGYGGFIGPKVVTYDFTSHLNAVFPVTEDYVN
ncbi:uncharacterized protein orion isoform X1 [Periplaneta americana]|uniref:uncharacterized protein orion isoform X1 n=1 Tax=Periplaneta americana TaxID=6978 RepID=UPI0037E99ED8